MSRRRGTQHHVPVMWLRVGRLRVHEHSIYGESRSQESPCTARALMDHFHDLIMQIKPVWADRHRRVWPPWKDEKTKRGRKCHGWKLTLTERTRGKYQTSAACASRTSGRGHVSRSHPDSNLLGTVSSMVILHLFILPFVTVNLLLSTFDSISCDLVLYE